MSAGGPGGTRPRGAAFGCQPDGMHAGQPPVIADLHPPGAAPFAPDPADARPRPRGWFTHVAVMAGCASLLGAGLFAGGFLAFTGEVAAMRSEAFATADGIVVFTGGAERVAGAVALIEGGHARRLLISGVHPDTSARQIGAMLDASPAVFDCCVDLDKRAANTIGNAAETAKWVRANGFSSLIVVTSAYHMPRSVIELAAAMPEVRIRPHAVSPESLDLDRWWASGGTTLLLLEEYLKYTAARTRLALERGGMASPILADLAR